MATASTAPLPADVSQALPADFVANPVFFLCLIAAIGLVYLFCRQKFNERSNAGNGDYVYQLLPSQLATPQEYNKGFLTYFGAMVFVVLLLSLIGPKDLGALGITLPQGLSNGGIALAAALLLVGVLPNVPVLQEIERRLRQYAHEIAYIPGSALATAERLSSAEFDFSSYDGDALFSDEMRGVERTDFTQSRRSLEYAWARLCALIYEQKSRLTVGAGDMLDTGLLLAYKNDLDLIESSKKSMEAEVAAYRTEKAAKPGYTNAALNSAIRSNLRKLYILLGCAVRIKKQPHNDINLALKGLGFKLDTAQIQRTNSDLKIVGLTVVAACVLLLEFTAVAISLAGVWQPSPVFPPNFVQPFVETAWVLIPHVIAIMVADLIRRRAIGNNWWFAGAGKARQAVPANYIRVAVVCGIAGYCGLVLWGVVFSAPTIEGLKIDAPYALLAMATGGAYVWHLDNAELDRRPLPTREIGYHALMTAVCGFIAATASWSIVFGTPAAVLDRILLTTALSIAVGLVLAWYVPRAAAAVRNTPLAEAKAERLRNLEALAAKRMGAAAEQWLDRPHPALDNKTPRLAASNIEDFEHVVSLLQGPQGLAA
jgi:hypothetical protein